jgi:hypothetical protein
MLKFFMLLFLVVASGSLAVTPDQNAARCSPERNEWVKQWLRAVNHQTRYFDLIDLQSELSGCGIRG